MNLFRRKFILTLVVIVSSSVGICSYGQAHATDTACNRPTGAGQAEFCDEGAWNLCTNEPPTDSRFWPTVGNGHLATVVHSDNVFMNGLYNGNGTESKRARIPAVTSLDISNISPSPVSKLYCLHMNEGIYVEKYTGDHWSVELRVFAHRTITRLLVSELHIVTDGHQPDITIDMVVNQGNSSDDIDFLDDTSGIQNVSYMHGTIQMPETPTSGNVPVHVYYTDIPSQLIVGAGVVTDEKHLYLASISPTNGEAKTSYVKGIDLHRQGTLETDHVDGWHRVWEAGRIDIAGNIDLAAATYSSLYYILSSMPTVDEITWPFVGLSPGDLAHGILHEGYGGHVFWDQETWMYPPILALHADLGKTLVNTRIRTLNASMQYASQRGYNGAMYTWESAFSGLDVCPWFYSAEYEIHVTGDVALAFQQYLMMTRDTEILKNGRLKEAILGIAEFWKSRVTKNNSRDLYEILDVMPPDEYVYSVNNSAYTNAVARISLLLPKYALGLIGETAPAEYEDIAMKLYVPLDETKQFHPEYDGYLLNTTVKQADVVLLGYPLLVNMTRTQRLNDLTLYEKETPGGPAMTWGMFCIGWLEFQEYEKALRLFNKQLANMQQPFNVWTENADGSGSTNFITGQGGFLQSILFGYGGVRIHSDFIVVDCIPITDTEALRIKGLDYLNSSVDIVCNITNTCIALVQDGDTQLYMEVVGTGERVPLKHNVSVCVNRQRVHLTSTSTNANFSSTTKSNVWSVSSTTKSNVPSVSSTTKSNVSSVSSTTKSNVWSVSSTTKSNVSSVSSTTKSNVSSVSSTTKSNVSSVSSTTKSNVSSVSSTTKSNVPSVSSTTKSNVSSVSSTTKSNVSSVSSTTKSNVSSVSSTTKSNVSSVSSTTKSNVSSVSSTTKSTVWSVVLISCIMLFSVL